MHIYHIVNSPPTPIVILKLRYVDKLGTFVVTYIILGTMHTVIQEYLSVMYNKSIVAAIN